MSDKKIMKTMDGNEACATVAYHFTDVAGISPHSPPPPYGGGSARTVLGFGSLVVQLVVIILVAYANGYVMKKSFQRTGTVQCSGDGEEASPHHDLMGIALLLCSHSWSRTGLGALI